MLCKNCSSTQSQIFPKLGLKTEDVFDLTDWYESYKDLYPGYSSDENEYEDDYMYESEEQAYSAANEALDMFDTLPNPIPIFRTIYAKTPADIDYEYLGESWSFEKSSALEFGLHANANYLLSAKVKPEHVNWEQTLHTYFEFSGGFSADDENEITVKDETAIFDVVTESI